MRLFGIILFTAPRSSLSPLAFLESVVPDMEDYDGFNIVCGTLDEVGYLSNRDPIRQPRHLTPGHVFGLSNSLLDVPWPKVERGKVLLSSLPSVKDQDAAMYEILQDQMPVADPVHPETGPLIHPLFSELLNDHFLTGWDPSYERAMAGVFVPSFPCLDQRPFGTRAQHILTISNNNEIHFTERFRHNDGTWTEQRFDFHAEQQ